jgi:uncharacterized OB-fold protein
MDAELLRAMLPEVTDANRPFWEGTLAGELRLQRCTACGVRRFPDGISCPNCLSTGVEWMAASGRATLWSWTRMHQVYFPAFRDDVPYLVVFAQLEEGPFMISSLVDPPEQLRLDLPLLIEFDAVSETQAVPRFRVTA